MQSFNYSDNAASIVQRLYDAAEEGFDPSQSTSLFEEADNVATFLENPKNIISQEEIQALSNKILQAFDAHSVGESHRLSEWIAKGNTAYKSLHHLFAVIAKIHENPDESTGILASIEHIDAATLDCIEINRQNRAQREAGHILEANWLQRKMDEATTFSKPDRYEHLNVFGNKHKHNVMQRDLVATLKIPGITVPASYGIETEQILEFLKVTAPKVFTLWEQLGALYNKTEKKEAFFKDQEVIDIQSSISREITDAFEKIDDEKAIEQLHLPKEMVQWIADVRKRGGFLITRSSGAEDTRTSANAGGNVSVPYVRPNPSEYVASIGEVVNSYFSEASLKNRINARHNPFEEPLKLAVTMQEIVGEEVGGSRNPADVPISLVLFTNEPLYVGKEHFRVMRISATYGHGEGVVGSEGIATDTILILQSTSDPKKLHIVYDNQLKPERLSPVMDNKTGKVKLKKIANTKEMAEQPVLNADLIHRLFQWGVIGEKFFDNHPTDMEIVIKNNRLNPVQARPINRPDLLPTYLDLKKIRQLPNTPISDSLATDMIVPGQASVVEISNPEEILIDQTLANAELLYDAEKHKLVVVGQKEGANTHPVVNFSNMGTPCLYARGKNYEKVQEFVEKVDAKHHLAVCMQAATISVWDTETPVQECSSKGFVVHPAKVAISLPVKGDVSRKSGVNPEIPQEIKDLLLNIRTADTAKVALNLLDELKTHGWLKDYSEKINLLRSAKKENPLLKRKIKPIIAAARSVEAKVNDTFLEVEKVLVQSQKPGRMEFLINVKLLETILFQEQTEGAIGQYSVLNMQESFEAADALIAYQKQLSHQAHFADILMDGSQSPVDEVFKDWTEFLLKLEPLAERTMQGELTGITTEEIEKFKNTIETIRKADALPFFLIFKLEDYLEMSPVDTIRSINRLMPSTEEPLIKQIFESKEKIRQLQANIRLFGDPKTYPAAFKNLQEAMTAFLSSQQPWLKKDQWETISPITRNLALQTMNELVGLYDSAIKSMKMTSSDLLSNIDKTGEFKKILGPYLVLLCDWAENTVGEGNFVLPKTSKDLNSYLNQLKTVLNKLPDDNPKQLKPSPDFNVSIAVLGSGFGRTVMPKHLEDAFTLIHQNLMACTSCLTKKMLSPDQIKISKLPNKLKEAVIKIYKSVGRRIVNYDGIGGSIGTPQMTGIELTPSGIKFDYNVPLRTHSGNLFLGYDKQSKKIGMGVQFVGQNIDNRWELLRDWVSILDAAESPPLQSRPKVTSTEVSFHWDITSIDDLDLIFEEYNNITEATLTLVTPNAKQIRGIPLLRGLIQSVEKRGYLLESAAALSKVTSMSPLSEILFTKVITNLNKDSEISILPKDLSLIIWGSSHEILTSLLLTLIKHISGEPLESALHSIKGEHAGLIRQQIELYMKDKDLKLLHTLLRNGASVQRYLYIKTPFLELWEELIKKGLGISELIKTIDSFEKKSPKLVALALELWDKLIENEHFYPQSLIAAKKAFFIDTASGTEMDTLRRNAFTLIRDTLKKDKGFSEAMDIADELSKSDYPKELASSLAIRFQLLKWDQGVEETIKAAAAGVLNDYDLVRGESIGIFKALLKKELEIPQIIACAKKVTEHPNTNVRRSSYPLWHEIISTLKNKKEITEVVAMIEHGYLNVDYTDSRNWTNPYNEIWGLLLDEGLGISECIDAVQKGINDSNPYARASSLGLLTYLVEKGEGIPEAISAAENGIKDPDRQVRDASLKLWSKLKPFLKNSPQMQQALERVLKDWAYWQYAVPEKMTTYYKDYWKSLSELKNVMGK